MGRQKREGPVAGLAVVVVSLAALAALAALPSAWGQAEQRVYSAFNGKVSYKIYCMNCHGVSGRGDGYLADSLKSKSTDLTALAEGNGGVYPADRVAASIDGREQVKSHGMREMPVWGDAFLWPEDNAERQAEVRQKIGDLVEYVRTLQDPPVPK